MWIRITKSCNQGLNTYTKGELIDRPESQIKLLPPDVYEPESSPYEAQADPAARARDQARQTFLRLQQESTLAADKLRTAVGIAADKQQSLYVTQSACEKLLVAKEDGLKKVTKLKNSTNRKNPLTIAKQTAKLETINRNVTITTLMVARITGELAAAKAEVELQSIFAETARLAADQAHGDLQSLTAAAPAKQEQPDEPEQPEQSEQSEPADNAEPEAAEPKDADNPEGQTVPPGDGS